MIRRLAVLSQLAATTAVQQYGPVVLNMAVALGLSLLLRQYVYPRPPFLLALVLSSWDRGSSPASLVVPISRGHLWDQLPELLGPARSSRWFGLPAPKPPKSFAVPAGQRIRLHIHQSTPPRECSAQGGHIHRVESSAPTWFDARRWRTHGQFRMRTVRRHPTPRVVWII
jgi:hypothetical protein